MAAEEWVRMRRVSSAFSVTSPVTVTGFRPPAISAFVVRRITARARLPAPPLPVVPAPLMAFVVKTCRSPDDSTGSLTFSLLTSMLIAWLVMAAVDLATSVFSSLMKKSLIPLSLILIAMGS